MIDNKLWEGFIRQRRNLLIVSLVLSLAQIGDLTIDQINVLGNVLKIGRPVVVTYAVWVFWVYWLYRYYVYFRDVGGSGFRLRYQEELFEILRKHVAEIVQHDAQVAQRLKDEKGTFIRASAATMELLGRVPYGYYIQARSLQVTYKKPDSTSETHLFSGERELTVPYHAIRRYQFRAIRFVVFHTRLITDFWLPYLVAGVPVLVAVSLYARQP